MEEELRNLDPGMEAVSCFSRPLMPRPCPSSPDARDTQIEICNLHKQRNNLTYRREKGAGGRERRKGRKEEGWEGGPPIIKF